MKKIQSIHFNVIHSTQTWIKENLDGLDPAIITRVTACCQTEGIGRRGNLWFSPNVGNLYTSWAISYPHDPGAGLSCQMLALAAVQFLENTYQIMGTIKWPNDIYYNEYKIGGIIAETKHNKENDWLIIGLGLNINNDPRELSPYKALSLKEITQKKIDPFSVLIGVEKQFFSLFSHIGPSTLEQIRQKQYLKGKKVMLESGNHIYTGSYINVDEKGGLILELEEKMHTFYSGHIVEAKNL